MGGGERGAGEGAARCKHTEAPVREINVSKANQVFFFGTFNDYADLMIEN